MSLILSDDDKVVTPEGVVHAPSLMDLSEYALRLTDMVFRIRIVCKGLQTDAFLVDIPEYESVILIRILRNGLEDVRGLWLLADRGDDDPFGFRSKKPDY